MIGGSSKVNPDDDIFAPTPDLAEGEEAPEPTPARSGLWGIQALLCGQKIHCRLNISKRLY